MPHFSSYVAIGDSFTEGVGDDLPDGTQRGWADFFALGLAQAVETPVTYANLAIRGRKLAPIIEEQLEPAIALGAELFSINGGGNDIMRPKILIQDVADQLRAAVDRAAASGTHVLMLSGANPMDHLPMGRTFAKRGDELAKAVLDWGDIDGVTYVDNWSDAGLRDIRYWSLDRLHLNALGHARVASNILTAFDLPVPADWGVEEVAAAPAGPKSRRTAAYYREYVMPWIGRRLTGRSSGDGRLPKRATLLPVSVD